MKRISVYAVDVYITKFASASGFKCTLSPPLSIRIEKYLLSDLKECIGVDIINGSNHISYSNLDRPYLFKICSLINPSHAMVNCTQDNGSEFSFEDTHSITISVALIALMGCLSLCNYIKFKRSKADDYLLNAYLFIVAGIKFLYLLLLLIFSITYAMDGRGCVILKVVAYIISSAANYVAIVMLIMLAHGWKLTYQLLTNYDIYVPVVIGLGMVHTLPSCFIQVDYDAAYKLTDREGAQWLIALIFNIIALTYFTREIIHTYKHVQKINQYIICQLLVGGTLYILCACYIITPWWINEVVMAILILCGSRFGIKMSYLD
jgi:Rhodopsin-like GPCR transmembrane domain